VWCSYEDDDLGFWPNLMDAIDKAMIGPSILGACNVVGVVPVVRTDIDNN
jgi:hypothetical protein